MTRKTEVLERLKGNAVWHWGIAPLLALLSQPILLGELAVLVGILVFSVGQQLGVPLQFFHERRGVQARAGFAATLAAAHLFFVTYLVKAGNDDSLQKPLIVWFGACWSLVVLSALVIRFVSRHYPERVSAGLKLSPWLRGSGEADDAAGAGGVPEVSPLPFLAGTLLACALLAAAACALDAKLGELDNLARGTMSWLGRSQVRHAGLHFVALSLALFVTAQLVLLRGRASAASALCSLLVLVATTIGASNYWFGASTVVGLLVLLLLACAGRERYAIRLSDLAPFYKDGPRFPYPPKTFTPAKGELSLADALVTANAQPAWPTAEGPSRRPLIMVCASGGGMRAAAWTAGLLARLSTVVPGFAESTLMVTGASGGMVGATYWLADRRQKVEKGRPALSCEDLLRLVSRDCLTAISRSLVLNDLPRAVFGGVNGADRGAKMQQTWADQAKTLELDLSVPLVSFAQGERRGLYPSLVFSPMIVEDGRRLLLSNLRLTAVSESAALWVEDFRTGRSKPASHSAFHVSDVFGAAAERITLATAARLSASFPYISPAAVLPTDPPTRVVDAGYYDNYGIDLCTGFLREALEKHPAWLEANVSGVLIIQIRDDESPLSEGQAGVLKALPPPGRGCFAKLARGLEGLTTPLAGFVTARESVMQLRNDAQLDAIAGAYRARFNGDFLAHELFELKGDVSLSWCLAESEIKKVLGQVEAVSDKLTKVAAWKTTFS